MTKFCPNCGKELPDESKFCLECGYDFSKKTSKQNSDDNSNIFLNGKVFLVLIAIILIVGAIFIFGSGNHGGADDNAQPTSGVSLTITEVAGYDSKNPKSYTYYVEALFSKVPSNMDEYMVKTIYYDENNTEIGNTIESLSSVYYDSDYPISLGHYTTYNLVKADSVKIQIIKDDKVLDEFSSKIDQNKIRW